jgi:hypothetical protein
MAVTTRLRQTVSLPGRLALSPSLLFLGGGALVFSTFMRFGIAELAWVTLAPFPVYLRECGTLKWHLALLATLVVAWLSIPSLLPMRDPILLWARAYPA